jgi:hypothetical protein
MSRIRRGPNDQPAPTPTEPAAPADDLAPTLTPEPEEAVEIEESDDDGDKQ